MAAAQAGPYPYIPSATRRWQERRIPGFAGQCLFLFQEFDMKLAPIRFVILSCCLLACVFAAQAIPLVLTASEFGAQTAGLARTVEDLEGLPNPAPSSPVVLANGSYTSSSPRVMALVDFCGDSDQCLLDAYIDRPRTFNALPSGTTFWATDLHLVNPNDVLDITVVGGSGTLNLTQTPVGSFLAFHDQLGLSSISFRNVSVDGSGTYSFDNITTASGTIGAPSSLPLVSLGLACLACLGTLDRSLAPAAGR
jgi:hypothetical protein